MARMGTLTEYTIPFVLAANINPLVTVLMLFVMVGFHGFIALNNPSGMPIEWNILMIYGGIFLFGFHPEASVLARCRCRCCSRSCCSACSRSRSTATSCRRASRSCSRCATTRATGPTTSGCSARTRSAKLGKLTKAADTTRVQLATMLPDPKPVDVALAMSLAHRFMHLEGRPLLEALPRAVDDIDDYEWIDGEVLGGHGPRLELRRRPPNNQPLLAAVQQQCGFATGELRVVMVESQPLFGRTMRWKVVDAADGVLAEGETEDRPMRAVQPYPTGAYAEAFMRARAKAMA